MGVGCEAATGSEGRNVVKFQAGPPGDGCWQCKGQGRVTHGCRIEVNNRGFNLHCSAVCVMHRRPWMCKGWGGGGQGGGRRTQNEKGTN